MHNESIEKLRHALSRDLNNYRAIPFWSWNNTLDEKELVKQIEDMKSVGMGGFIMHARTGLKDEYLGEKWFSCIGACLKKARELGMNAWIYDENGWPSGFVGGKLLEREDFRAQFLRYEIKDAFDGNAFCVFREKDENYVRIFQAEDDITEYHCVYLCTSPANTDILNPEVVDAFIRETHEEYYRRFPDSFGRELAGFFTDEPQCYRAETPYSRFIRDEYQKQFGEDVCNYLIYLFVQNAEGYAFRERYYTLMNLLYVETFYKKIYDWCEAHNCKLTGHSIEESGLHSQMLGGAGVSATYEYEHIPAIDWLGRECGNEIAPKQVGSVASQLGIHHVLTETFACCGYDVTPKELKSIGEFQYFNGVNMMCHHLYPYSLANQGKYDHPPIFSKQANWWDEFRTFNEYFTRLGYLIANTRENYDVLIVHPLRSVYLNYTRSGKRDSVLNLENSFKQLIADLRKNGVCYQFVDESILEKYGRIEDGNLTVGKCTYKTVLIPNHMDTLAKTTYSLLQAFQGNLIMLGKPYLIDGRPAEVKLTQNMTFAQLLQSTAIDFHCEDGRIGMTSRSSELGDYLFIKNYSRVDSGRFVTKGVSNAYRALDLETFALRNISDEMELGACESLILVKDANASPAVVHQTAEDITDRFRVSGITENSLVMDTGSVSFNGTDFGEVLPLQRIFEDLLRKDYCGPLYIRQTFRVKVPCKMKLVLEKADYRSLSVNGTELTLVQNGFDINFAEADISHAVVCGENVLQYRLDYYQHDGVHFALFDPLATESVVNCLYYDTHIENTYIQGDFTVDGNLEISKRNGKLPPLTSKLYENGYPFFSGDLTLCGSYIYDGVGDCVLKLDGRFIAAEVTVNGVRTDFAMDFKKDITSLLKKGENRISVHLHSGLRNLLGPHHYAPVPEPIAVSPVTFTMRKAWNGGIAPNYTPVYQSVPFGVDTVQILKTI